jgi:ABC-2 type transport system permease protein
MLERLKSMLIKEFTQILRDPKMRAILTVVPIFQIIVFGYAVNTDVRHIATAVHDLDNSPVSRELVARLEQSGYFDITQHPRNDREIRDLLDRGTVKAVVQINHGFMEQVQAGRPVTVPLITDGTDPNTARIVLSHALKIVGNFSESILLDQLRQTSGASENRPPVTLESRAWFNDNLESRNYYVPGVTAMMVLITTMMLSSMAVVREKEIGTMEQIIVTPIRRWEFILGKTIPFALIGFTNVTIVSLVAFFWFRIPLRGSLPLLFAATGLYLLSTLGFGLFISTISQTQQQAMMSSFMFTFPAMLLSGFAFPIDNMPQVIQWATLLNPLRYYLVIIRSIFLKGVGVAVLWPPLAGLAILGTLILSIAVYRFRKTVN